MKKYDVYIAGGEKLKSIYATCITKACKSFVGTLDKQANYSFVRGWRPGPSWTRKTTPEAYKPGIVRPDQ